MNETPVPQSSPSTAQATAPETDTPATPVENTQDSPSSLITPASATPLLVCALFQVEGKLKIIVQAQSGPSALINAYMEAMVEGLNQQLGRITEKKSALWTPR